MREPLFEVTSKLGVRVRVSRGYWEYIVSIKHPSLKGLEGVVREALANLLEVRRSPRDPRVYLYYGTYMDKLICVVVKHLNSEGFIITAYN
ncbi:hypothetical protein [Thermofilum pendens]|uniref:Uncharacterized protein n=1 Tax=Thermofilum pendens (strain DSM 2475 / Hrk 5) TaxID=368408 RepID=A1S100_THEPD|nr:hypothetical protein [Thermofilum pendens]ABL79130.1 hypothetical protein Tpen_1735 [Thermofilum pendens Hrk 5]